ncbi:MAG: hypothetical protein QXW55_02425 [Candidatus Bathyarchaeia archaeon]
MVETIPGCLGYYGIPLPPNGPCEKCETRELCKYTAKHFVPKKKLQPIFQRLLALEKSMEEG